MTINPKKMGALLQQTVLHWTPIEDLRKVVDQWMYDEWANL